MDDSLAKLQLSIEWTDSLYRAIGRLAVHFQWLVFAMAGTLASIVRVDPECELPGHVVYTLLGDMQPGPLLQRIDDVLSRCPRFPGDDDIVQDVVRRINRLIAERNRIIHDRFLVDPNFAPSDPTNRSTALFRIRHTKSGPKFFEGRFVDPEEIEQLADEAEVLFRVLKLLASVSDESLFDYLEFDGNGNVRFLPEED